MVYWGGGGGGGINKSTQFIQHICLMLITKIYLCTKVHWQSWIQLHLSNLVLLWKRPMYIYILIHNIYNQYYAHFIANHLLHLPEDFCTRSKGRSPISRQSNPGIGGNSAINIINKYKIICSNKLWIMQVTFQFSCTDKILSFQIIQLDLNQLNFTSLVVSMTKWFSFLFADASLDNSFTLTHNFQSFTGCDQNIMY